MRSGAARRQLFEQVGFPWLEVVALYTTPDGQSIRTAMKASPRSTSAVCAFYKERLLDIAHASAPSPTSKAAKPVVALILPITAGVVVEDSKPDDVLGVFAAEFGRNAHAHREAEFGRQDLIVELERHLRL